MDLSERPVRPASSLRRHPWETARFKFFEAVLADQSLASMHVLDAGAGDGWFARELFASLPGAARVTCWDAYYTPDLLNALRCGAGGRLEFTAQRPRELFDLILLLDVLEHVEHDHEFLATLVQENLAASGVVLISVPAWQGLFTAHDTRLRHYRRYAPHEAIRLIEQNGLTIVRQGGLFHSLLLPRVAAKLLELWRPPSAADEPPVLDWHGGPFVTRMVEWALAQDRRVSLAAERLRLPLPGLSWWALCQKL
jgi:hypothetical protein